MSLQLKTLDTKSGSVRPDVVLNKPGMSLKAFIIRVRLKVALPLAEMKTCGDFWARKGFVRRKEKE